MQKPVWNTCKKILCIRADNMGDLIMTTPALKALKETFHCHITVLTSTMAQSITGYIPVIDEVIVRDLPWIKSNTATAGTDLIELAALLRSYQFDAAIIFTVYSQSALPAALFTMMAGIPLRLAYSRENPYDLLTHWLPDKEPYSFVQHQVKRDLALVAVTGAFTNDDRLLLVVSVEDRQRMQNKLQQASIDTSTGYLLFHPGVSEEKRKYPLQHWITLGQLVHDTGLPILLTGTTKEKELTSAIAAGIGDNATDVAGQFTTGEFIALTAGAAGVVSVNTATIHIAAACETPVVVLYALTNPQHTPWKVSGQVFPYDVPESLQSKNEVIGYVRDNRMMKQPALPRPAVIAQALESLLQQEKGDAYIAPDTLIL
ncbi:glycosyl transferase family 9 [Niastella koreensis GR20-10]|uniref:Glycosyl transferase family 9 n=2 Tax=Niastella koreensis TaxID=354356 RepID=G8TJ52_NIAKG|nr:glycosyltransferase family 9 protein [Niastella koreensis]AEV98585.1 glycosyl transferase family 9 [Niastella koreensis GR20-10]